VISIDLRGRVVLVTGAVGTIGSAVSRCFKEAGASVLGVDRVPTTDVRGVDVTSEASLTHLVNDITSGGGHLTDVVHAAGTVRTGAVLDTPLTAVEGLVMTNLLSTFALARALLPVMRSGGSFTVIASQAAFHGAENWSAYCASKSGVVRLVESLAKEVGPVGVRSNAVCPGSVDSAVMNDHFDALATREGTTAAVVRQSYIDANPLRRLASADDVAAACLFLASPLASYVNGAALNVDGGESPG
jgi:meso-butanediol dehydrogenase/(S,S)-butanediol dehydrogenase/diacetyl reductase